MVGGVRRQKCFQTRTRIAVKINHRWTRRFAEFQARKSAAIGERQAAFYLHSLHSSGISTDAASRPVVR
jgi:hypothetical protein